MSNLLQKKGIWLPIKTFLILIIIALSALTLVGSYLLRNVYDSIAVADLQYTQSQINSMQNDQVSEKDKKLIDRWLVKNNLNQYGDAMDTEYAGGSPLFDEATGEAVDRYNFIILKYPQKPWKNN